MSLRPKQTGRKPILIEMVQRPLMRTAFVWISDSYSFDDDDDNNSSLEVTPIKKLSKHGKTYKKFVTKQAKRGQRRQRRRRRSVRIGRKLTQQIHSTKHTSINNVRSPAKYRNEINFSSTIRRSNTGGRNFVASSRKLKSIAVNKTNSKTKQKRQRRPSRRQSQVNRRI